MIDSFYPTTEQLQARKRTRANRMLIFGMLVVAVALGSMVAILLLMKHPTPESMVATPIVLITLLTIPVVIWNYPSVGFYLILIGLTVFGGDSRVSVSKIPTNYLPVFLPINNIGDYYGMGGALAPIKFTPFELLTLFITLVWIVQGIVRRDTRLRTGPFLLPLLGFLAFVTYGVIHGLTSGGDTIIALMECRGQYSLLLFYLLAVNLITDKKQVTNVLWVFVIGIGIRSVLGLMSYIQMQGTISDQGILEHEDSLVMDALFFIPLLLAINKGNRKLMWTGMLFLPTAILTEIENNRRAGIASFVLAFIIFLPMLWVIMKSHRKQVGLFVAFIGLVSAVYLPVAWNSQASWAMPARAIRSNSDPNSRDAASNLYRLQEDGDLKYTRDLNPLLGYGYGKRWIQIIPLPHVSTDYMYYFAHDSVLWFWMSTGHLGFFFFMLLIANVLIRGTQICKEMRDPIFQTVACVAVLFTLMTFVFGKYDLQLFDTRTMGMMVVLIAITGMLPTLQAAEEAKLAASPPTVRDPEEAFDPVETFTMPEGGLF